MRENDNYKEEIDLEVALGLVGIEVADLDGAGIEWGT
jgi:hypothetical protein